MSEHLIIEVEGRIEDAIIKEINDNDLQVASEKFLSGTELISAILVPVISIVTEKTISGIIDKISMSKDRFTIKHKGKVYKNLSGEGAKKIISSIMKGNLPE